MKEDSSRFWQSRVITFTLVPLALTLIGALDYITGPDISLSPFYLVPGLVVGWFRSKREGIAVAFVSSVVWLTVELKFGKEYRHAFVPYCNWVLQLLMCVSSATLMVLFRQRQNAMIEEMAARKRAEMQLQVERVLAEAIEKEQQRLGRDLHDGLGQHLVSTGFVASMLKTKLEERFLPEAQEAQEITHLISEAIGETRRISRGLFPVKLEAEGLSSALQELSDNVSARAKVNCRFEESGTEVNPPIGVSSNLYRIAQEAVNNAVKHGEPINIVVQLHQGKSFLELLVLNDGKEFLRQNFDNEGMGLRIMEYRARLIGGSCFLGPGPTGGAKVHCVVPLQMGR